MVQMEQDHQSCSTHKKILKTMLGKYGKSQILIARQHFSLQEIYAASRLFCAHSADLVKSYM
jgi:hypothetical protein